MKRFSVFISLLLGVYIAHGQPSKFFESESFEVWDSSQGYLNPANWYSLNTLTTFGFDPTLERTSHAHTGNFAVMLESKDNSTFGPLSGVLTTGPLINPTNGNPDFSAIKLPYTAKPTRFQYYYQSNPVDGDSNRMALVLTRWNIAFQRPDTIGFAFAAYGDSMSTYQLADLEIQYRLPLTPDSIFIIASSSYDGFNPTPGSKFYLDDFTIVGGSSGIEQLSINDKLMEVFPNPAKENLTIIRTEKIKAQLQVFDALGKRVWIENVNEAEHQINVNNWLQGIYFIEVTTPENRIVKKIVIE